jgi:hypothetical protein
MCTANEERNLFSHVTCHISTDVDEVTGPGALTLDVLEQVCVLIVFSFHCKKKDGPVLN